MTKIETERIKEVLDKVKIFIPPTNLSLLEEQVYILFKKDGMYMTDGFFQLFYPFILGEEIIIEGFAFSQIICKIEDSYIHFQKVEDKLNLRTRKIKAEINVLSEYPYPLHKNPDNWLKLPNNFSDILKKARSCVLEAVGEPVLSCVYITPESIESTDAIRCFIYDLKENPHEIKEPFLINLNEIKKLIPIEPVSFVLKEDKMFFKNQEGLVLSFPLLKGNFPNTSSLKKNEGEKFSFPLKEVIRAIDRSNALIQSIQKNLRWVQITINSERIKLRGESSRGMYEEIIEKENKELTKEIQFFLTPYLIEEITDPEENYISYLSNKTISFVSKNYKYILALRNL